MKHKPLPCLSFFQIILQEQNYISSCQRVHVEPATVDDWEILVNMKTFMVKGSLRVWRRKVGCLLGRSPLIGGQKVHLLVMLGGWGGPGKIWKRNIIIFTLPRL